jgi:hypothetical protein
VVVGGAEGPPIEEVQLTRDEMADLGWAIERTVTGAAGQRVDRHEHWRDRVAALPASTPPDVPADVLVYDLADEPPDHWTPREPQSGQLRPPAAYGRAAVGVDTGQSFTTAGLLVCASGGVLLMLG